MKYSEHNKPHERPSSITMTNVCGEGKNQPISHAKKGGNRAVLFIYVTVALENMAFSANAVSLFTYFYGYMNFNLTKSATTLTNFMGTCFLLSLFGGFISDTYMPRFKTAILFGSIEVLGYAILTAQAHFGQLRPFPCVDTPSNNTDQCETANTAQVAILYAGLYLIAVGVGGVKSSVPALGADQFDENAPKEAQLRSSYFNWFLFSFTVGGAFGVTFIVWISTNQGWDLSFGICAVAILLAFFFLCMRKSLFRNNVPKGSPIIRILQVFVAAFRNRNFPVPAMSDELYEIDENKDGISYEIIQRSDQLKFLDRAAIVTDREDLLSTTPTTWCMVTVTQIEETKILIRMFPIILSTIFMFTCLAQLQTFSIQQSTTMNKNLFGFQIPGPSIPVIPLIFMSILLPLYDRVFIPIVRKFTRIPTGIRHLQRVGIGLVLSAVSMAVAGIIETKRKSVAFDYNMVDSPEQLPITVFWLGFQFAIFGMADMFTLVGLLEFFYAESSSGMKSLGTGISWCSMAFGFYFSSVLVEVVNKASGGWLGSNNLNRDKLNYFYWLLAGLSIVNFGVYVTCASWYTYKKVNIEHVAKMESDSKPNIDSSGV